VVMMRRTRSQLQGFMLGVAWFAAFASVFLWLALVHVFIGAHYGRAAAGFRRQLVETPKAFCPVQQIAPRKGCHESKVSAGNGL